MFTYVCNEPALKCLTVEGVYGGRGEGGRSKGRVGKKAAVRYTGEYGRDYLV